MLFAGVGGGTTPTKMSQKVVKFTYKMVNGVQKVSFWSHGMR